MERCDCSIPIKEIFTRFAHHQRHLPGRSFFQVVHSRYSSYSFCFVGGKAPSSVGSPGTGRSQSWVCGGISGSGKTRYYHINSESGGNFVLHVLKLPFSAEKSKVNVIKIYDQVCIAPWSALLRFYPGGTPRKIGWGCLARFPRDSKGPL